ncbi:MAG: transposase [Bacteroidetes bacterium]|nr:transposase [Bacteroidota bacterium]
MKWGFQNGKQRYRCKECPQLFIWSNEGKRYAQMFVWFEQWVIGKQTLVQVSNQSGYSKSKIQRLFRHYLNAPPQFTIPQKESVHIIIDGTYFSSDICLVVYRNSEIKCTQFYRLSDNERYEEIKEDLENLRALNIQIQSITCDGHRATLKAIRKVFQGKIIVQRCLVHIQRMSCIWLTQEPKSMVAKELLKITWQIHAITTHQQKLFWLRALYDWDVAHQLFINEKSVNTITGRTWYTHKMIRRVRYLLIHAFPDMFHYLDNAKIPKSTNALESFFGHLKDNLNIHRGLTVLHRKNFIRWYLFLRNKNIE